MSDLVEITLLNSHSVAGRVQAEGAQCVIHKGVADDLIGRGIACLSEDLEGADLLFDDEPSPESCE